MVERKFWLLTSSTPDFCCPEGATFSRRSPRKSVDRYTRRNENFVLVRSNRAITVAAQNRRLALVTNILSRASNGAVPLADFILPDVHHNQTTALMAKFGLIETCIAGEKRYISPPAQKRHDLLVLHPLAADVDSNLPCRYPGGLQ